MTDSIAENKPSCPIGKSLQILIFKISFCESEAGETDNKCDWIAYEY